MQHNVWRYVALARSRGGMSFCDIVKGTNYSICHKMQPVRRAESNIRALCLWVAGG